ncbi:fibronectin type III domain-containing protein [Blastopirellula sp. JC732]|uniref:Fibronectin type III domain-containing protein n=1 Tax=Blastopirellula sediminis TaxID=2894196 RepID=A0A9X1MJE3_9BACT|nr:fibronectin type III domain-containing protein [Blastopirellula sediminis]MCC9607770.1 fibronectin type III domain-containing protein [Blastopirellula sediminis]MCC9627437.1 fibronectin type III domain-containing protein [Blastopirellula sediminis]
MHQRFLLGLIFLVAIAASWPAASTCLAETKTPSLDHVDYHLFLVAGQSNAQGWLGENREGLNEPIPVPERGTVFYFDPEQKKILDVVDAKPEAYVGNAAGFHNRFAIDYHATTGKKVIFVHGVHGNSGIVPGVQYGGGNWPDAYRAALRDKYQAFKTTAAASNFAGQWGLAGLIWGQGEAEEFLLAQNKKTLPQLEKALSDLFDGFVQDYGDDYPGQPGSLINVVLVSIFAYPSGSSDRFYPDSPAWAATREMQRHVAQQHASARMVYFPIEKIFTQQVWPNNAVHYYQKQYNEIGRVMAQEIAKPGSTIQMPQPPNSAAAKAVGAWRVDLTWHAPEGGIPGELPVYRIYRRQAGESAWTWIWQTAEAPADGLHDENGVLPNTTYEYRIGARNEFGEVFSDVASAKTGRLSDNPLAAYQELAEPQNAAAVEKLWAELRAGGHTKGLRSLHLMTKGSNAASGKIFNLVRGADDQGRFDFTASNTVEREEDGYVFAAPSGAQTEAPLIPTYGPFTCMANLSWLHFPDVNESFGLMAQGRGYPAPPENSRSIFSYGPAPQTLNFYHEDQVGMFQTGGKRPAVGQAETFALTYDGRDMTWRRSDSEPIVHPNTIYFFNMQNAPFEIYTTPSSSTEANFKIAYLAVWNRAIGPEEFAAVQTILANRLRLPANVRPR